MKQNWIKIASIYIGTVIGAGFASGREIMEFFGLYGIKGIWGLYISGFLFSIIGSMLLLKIYNNKINNLNELLEKVFSKKIRKIIDIIIIISLYTGFTIMVAGSGAIFQEQMGKTFNQGILIMLISCFVVFLFDLEGFSLINTILVPILIVGILFVVYYIWNQEGYNFSNIEGINIDRKGNFISSAILYFGSNSLIIIVVFSSLLPLLKDKKTAIIGGLLGGTILYLLAAAILYSMFLFYNEVLYADIPMMKISDYIGRDYGKIYTIVLWLAMFTTALANGFGFIDRISGNKNQISIILFLYIITIPLAKIGFVNLVAVIYPISGLIGSTIIILILLS